MNYRVIITSEAFAGVERFLDYIAIDQQAPLNAERWWRKALAAVESLEQFPHRGSFAPENEFRSYEIRMLIVDRCLFLYTIEETTRTVRVFGFRHGSQLPRPDELPSDPPAQ
jgi:plasmid stabilization system protein ParE